MFKSKPDQIDFTHIREAPVINCVVRHKDNILLVRRSFKVHFYPGLWNGISGFLDDSQDEMDKVREELEEELSLGRADILNIRSGKIFEVKDPSYDKVWLVHTVLVEVGTEQVKLNWEATDYVWIPPEKLSEFELVPGFEKVVAEFALNPSQ